MRVSAFMALLMGVLLMTIPARADMPSVRLAMCDHLLPGEDWSIYGKLTLPDGQVQSLLGLKPGADLPESCRVMAELPVSMEQVSSVFVVPESQVPAKGKSIILEGDLDREGRFVPYAVETIDEGHPAPSKSAKRSSVRSPVQKTPGRSAWLWNPAFWQDGPKAALFDQLADWKIRTVYIFVPMEDHASVLKPDALAAFIAEAGKRGVAVFAVDGDPTAILPEFHKIYVSRTRAYVAYNGSVPRASRLSGVQYDFEPHSLNGFLLDPDSYFAYYLTALKALRKNANDLEVEIAVPVSYLSNPSFHGRSFLKAASKSIDRFVVMDYKTALPEIINQAEPFLDLGADLRKTVKIALEAGDVEMPTLEMFKPSAPSGNFWILKPTGNTYQLGVLLRDPVHLESGQGFTYVRKIVPTENRISFHGRLPQMRDSLGLLEQEWSRNGAFGGLAVHDVFQY